MKKLFITTIILLLTIISSGVFITASNSLLNTISYPTGERQEKDGILYRHTNGGTFIYSNRYEITENNLTVGSSNTIGYHFYFKNESDIMQITYEHVDKDGNLIRTIKDKVISAYNAPTVYSPTTLETHFFRTETFSVADYNYTGEYYFLRIRVGETVLSNHLVVTSYDSAFTKEHIDNDLTGVNKITRSADRAVALGSLAYSRQTGYLHIPSTPVTVTTDDFIIVHYRIPDAESATLDYYVTLQNVIVDDTNILTEYSFNIRPMVGVLNDYHPILRDNKESFFIVPVNGTLPAVLQGINDLNLNWRFDDPFNTQIDNGVYLSRLYSYSTVTGNSTIIGYEQGYLFVSNSLKEFGLNTDSKTVQANSIFNFRTFRDSEKIFGTDNGTGFKTISLTENNQGTDFTNAMEEYSQINNFSFTVHETSIAGEVYRIRWVIDYREGYNVWGQPITDTWAEEGKFIFILDYDYLIIDGNLTDTINSLVKTLNLDDNAGYAFIILIITVLFNILFVKIKPPLPIWGLLNAGLVVLFNVFGWTAFWYNAPMILLILYMLFSNKEDVSE